MVKKVLIYSLLLIINFSIASADELANKYCKSTDSCWPNKGKWQELKNSLKDKLIIAELPTALCVKNEKSHACKEQLKKLQSPYYIESYAAGYQSTGWVDGWDNQVAAYSLVASNAEDIAKVVKFAKKHNIKVAIKGAGHDYLGRSNADENSILIWTHNLRGIKVEDEFICKGCEFSDSTEAVTVSAGQRWLEVYNEVMGKHKRFVQGGGCTSVGAVGGWALGGGFGSFSRMFGTGASNILEAEIVTADGDILTVNKYNHPDLFWALKGGGGGTYGVVTKLTMKTYELADHINIIQGTVKAKDDKAFKETIAYLVEFYKNLQNPHYGEKIVIGSDNSITFLLSVFAESEKDIKDIWEPFLEKLKLKGDSFSDKFDLLNMKSADFYSKEYLAKKDYINTDNNYWWWKGDASQISVYWSGYSGRYLDKDLLLAENKDKLVDALFAASRLSNVELHVNKGMYNATKSAIERIKDTSMNPKVYNAASFVIVASATKDIYHKGSKDKELLEKARLKAKNVDKAYDIIKSLSPDSGSYANEASYFTKNWQEEFWGDNYAKLLEVKRKYDPTNIFTCHHCVGSE